VIDWKSLKFNFKKEKSTKVVSSDGSKLWYLNDQLHRTDGPAVLLSNGTKEWWINGQLHRTDGPAVEYPNGRKQWYINGKEYTKEDFALIQFTKGINIYV